MPASISGTMLADLVSCERRVHHDLHTDAARRDAVSSFIRMLWEGGRRHEVGVLGALDGEIVDLREMPAAGRAAATLAALAGAADWILGGRLELDDRVGLPDLLRRVEGVWYAGDVKSGAPWLDGGPVAKPSYSVQIGHYAALLGDLGLGERDRGFVIGADGGTGWYDLDAAIRPGGEAIAERVDRLVGEARLIRDGLASTTAAASSLCGLCHWRSVCRAELEAADDVTLVAGLGRSLRASIGALAPTVTALAAVDPSSVRVPGVGRERLARFRDRARLLRTPGASAYARGPLSLRRHARELHLDLEADPLRGVVYLHGILVREQVDGEDRDEFVHFFADGPDGEREAFADAWRFLTADPSAHVFYYSKFERTSYRSLQARYPDVCSTDEVEALFAPDRATDLYFDVVASSTEWPLGSYGIKPIAKHLGFAWRDADASGAASIAWYDEYLGSGDPAVRTRIVEYNADDCRATCVLLDALIALPVATGPAWPPTAVGAKGAAS